MRWIYGTARRGAGAKKREVFAWSIEFHEFINAIGQSDFRLWTHGGVLDVNYCVRNAINTNIQRDACEFEMSELDEIGVLLHKYEDALGNGIVYIARVWANEKIVFDLKLRRKRMDGCGESELWPSVGIDTSEEEETGDSDGKCFVVSVSDLGF